MQLSNLEKIKEKTILVFDKYLGEDYILFLFGSFAKNDIDRTSDIDLAFYCKENIPISVITQIREELDEKAFTLRNTDLVNLNEQNIDRGLLDNILKEGAVWKAGRNSKELLKSLKRHLENLRK
ncbi:MAG: nucleotidyltransferase domain-containing protein [Nanoarchaeota archaeon]|nr:nucleotidyltransferase domain-containing protein [Nanoarchaeota archaeon]